MTVDTVNTDIFDDDKITGILCVWFVGEKLERVRFDHRAIETVQSEKVYPRTGEEPSQEASGEYKAVLDEMVDAMNHSAEEMCSVGPKKRKPARTPKNSIVPASTITTSGGS